MAPMAGIAVGAARPEDLAELAAEEAADWAAEVMLASLELSAASMEDDWAPLVALARALEADDMMEETSLLAELATEEAAEPAPEVALERAELRLDSAEEMAELAEAVAEPEAD